MGKPPGVAIRLKDRTFDSLMLNLNEFFPSYITVDLDLNKEQEVYTFHTLFGLLTMQLEMTDFEFETPTLDLKDTNIYFVEEWGSHYMKVHFPTL